MFESHNAFYRLKNLMYLWRNQSYGDLQKCLFFLSLCLFFKKNNTFRNMGALNLAHIEVFEHIIFIRIGAKLVYSFLNLIKFLQESDKLSEKERTEQRNYEK